ncbi:MAG: PD40 domain-containing protein, partial [Acidobacteriia bacterium]|nr:PD40 domain-containing protein [Terriglobia bacterium]MBV8902290.1 PD40 domain-containing protein [Terriglobia bacterium]
EWERYLDETTEFQVYRLTDPSYTSSLPGPSGRAISRNSATLLYSSDRTGSRQAFRMDLKSGDTQQLTERNDIDGSSLTLLPDSHSFCYFARRVLYFASLGNLRDRAVYTIPEGWDLSSGLHAGPDGAHVVFAERRAGSSRLRSVALAQGSAHTILEAPFEITDPVERPQRLQILYRQFGKGLWVVTMDGRTTELKTAPGTAGSAIWSPDGRTLLYLHFPEDPKELNAIREYTPETQSDKLVAKTSQYAGFAPNRDASVFVSASRNAASPAILIMLRIVRRELTLCEHRASHPDRVSPMFSPDAQRIYFQSDRHGKQALYALHVERLVERIEEDSQ